MIKFAEQIEKDMITNLRPKFASRQERLSLALQYLNNAAEEFDKAGNDKFAEIVTNFITKLGQEGK